MTTFVSLRVQSQRFPDRLQICDNTRVVSFISTSLNSYPGDLVDRETKSQKGTQFQHISDRKKTAITALPGYM